MVRLVLGLEPPLRIRPEATGGETLVLEPRR
jgi:hypothetical protein